MALSPVPVPKPGAVPALIPSDGHKEGAEGRDEVEPPLHLGHPDPPEAAAGGGPRSPRGVAEVGDDVGSEAMRKLVPHEGHTSLEDCPLDEDEDAFQALGEEDEDIDQFNDDTFGAGAVDDDWQEAHERLAELEDKAGSSREPDGPVGNDGDVLGDPEDALAERLTRLVIDSELEDPAIMQAVHTRDPPQQPGGLNSSIWDSSAVLRRIRGPLLAQEMPSVSVLDYALPQRPPQARDEERDPSERALPRRSSSPVIGSPPVRVVPIGTPPKQAGIPNFNQQILCPKPVHIRATMQQRYPAPYGERMSPNQLCNVPNSSLLGHPFPHSVSPVLTHLQRAQLLGGAQAGRMSPSQFARVSGLVGSPLPSVNPKLLQGRVGQMMSPAGGFRAFFGAPPAPPPSQLPHPQGPGSHLQNLRPQPQMFRPDTTHLHPQHRRLLHQRQQQNRNQHRSLNGSGGDRGGHRSSHQEQIRKDPYANLMLQREKDWVSKIQMMQLQSTDPYLDDYYYQNYFQKLEKLAAAEEVHGDGPKKERTKLITPQVAKLEHTYKPVQFEGSLGKLTVSSVNNPRKMIDAVVTSRSEDDETKEKQVRDKRRQTLVTIEKTYSLLLDVEDYERRYLLSLEGERPALMGERKQKICDMYDNLRGKAPGQDRLSDDHFMQIMCIRKGKRLVARILPFLAPEQAADVLMATARNLPFLIKKDAQDEVLPCLLRPFSHVLYHLPLGTVTSLVQQLTNLPQSAAAPTNLHLTAVLQNKFGLSLLYLVLSRGEELQSSDTNTELMQDNQWTELMLMATRELLRIPQGALAKPVSIPSNLISLFSRYVDQQKLNLLETKLHLVHGIR
ncbi:protein PAT1 homolog 1 isoform X1 [Corvus hawaiiensis]|uniref:protein PAT1 homolog 1 isoform X1 n=1 Tax=Corvus hawaiiensis TaxID=134902 RepID=UPI002019A4D2|nr:protein PAT1 homolog 1 isoform X1 [Corvus hawaiiensis]